MAQYSNILIVGDKVLLNALSCATLVFEKECKRNKPNAYWRVDSIEVLQFILNKSGLNLLIDTFNLGYNGEVLTEKFKDNLLNKYGPEKVEQYAYHTSV